MNEHFNGFMDRYHAYMTKSSVDMSHVAVGLGGAGLGVLGKHLYDKYVQKNNTPTQQAVQTFEVDPFLQAYNSPQAYGAYDTYGAYYDPYMYQY